MANDLPGTQPGTKSTSVKHPCSLTSSPLSQPPIPAANQNAECTSRQDHSEIWGLYKPAQIDPRQDLAFLLPKEKTKRGENPSQKN